MSTSTLFFRIAVIAQILMGLSVSGLRAQNPSFVESTPSVFNFTAGGSGAQARNVAFKLDEFRSVTDYGAKGDDAIDDTQALQDAVATGASLYFPPGKYILKSTLRLRNNQKIMGAGWNSILSLEADNSTALSGDGATDIAIVNLKIDGTGKRQVEGIRLTDCVQSTISSVWVTGMGQVNTSDVKTDGDYGGVGILLSSRGAKDCAWITIERCRVDHIAGGGFIKGDGIEIGDYSDSTGTVHDVSIRDCFVSTVGRHCYAAGGDKPRKPYNIYYERCYGEKSALDWLDVEDAQSVRVVNGVARRCGNDQTYFNPASAYGANYGLLAAIAVGNASGKVEVSGFSADSCYLGWTAGGSTSVELDHVTITNSTRADYALTLANHPTTITIRNSAFLTPGKTEVFYYDGSGSVTPKRFSNVIFSSPVNVTQAVNLWFEGCEFRDALSLGGTLAAVKELKIAACKFASQVRLNKTENLTFGGCSFASGIVFQTSGIKDIDLEGCKFTDFAGAGISWSAISLGTRNLVVRNCQFLGTGQMTYGINAVYQSVYRSKISDNVFSGLTTAGVGHSALNGDSYIFEILRNRFDNMPVGIDMFLATRYMRITGNSFENISGWAISQQNIFSSAANEDNLISENITGASVANGFRITNVNGTINYISILGNNFRSVTGTAYAISGNANGMVANNIPAVP
jgi:hypothetical protein